MSTLHLLFKVGEAEYVLPASEVREMESFTGATRIPGALSHVAGLVQIRGKVIPVIDLRVRFGLTAIERTIDSRVIVVSEGTRDIGLLADSAREVLKIDDGEFKPPPEVVAEQAAGFVSSIAQAGKRLVMRLDTGRVIATSGIPEEISDGKNA
jgi:purine-binding chemotaxis protein CheW